MKKIFTSAFFLLALITAEAQTADIKTPQLKAQAIDQTRELAAKIGLNELEYIKIKNYTLKKMIAIQEVNQLYSNDADMQAKKLADIEAEYQKNVVATLSPKQQMNYVALHSQQKAQSYTRANANN